jgi:hypothetical protein
MSLSARLLCVLSFISLTFLFSSFVSSTDAHRQWPWLVGSERRDQVKVGQQNGAPAIAARGRSDKNSNSPQQFHLLRLKHAFVAGNLAAFRPTWLRPVALSLLSG